MTRPTSQDTLYETLRAYPVDGLRGAAEAAGVAYGTLWRVARGKCRRVPHRVLRALRELAVSTPAWEAPRDADGWRELWDVAAGYSAQRKP